MRSDRHKTQIRTQKVLSITTSIGSYILNLAFLFLSFCEAIEMALVIYQGNDMSVDDEEVASASDGQKATHVGLVKFHCILIS